MEITLGSPSLDTKKRKMGKVASVLLNFCDFSENEEEAETSGEGSYELPLKQVGFELG